MARTKVNLKTTASLLKFASEVDPTGVQASTSAIADLDAAEDSCTLPPGRYRVDADLTLSAGWRCEPGAVLVPDNLVTITLPAAFEGRPGCLDTSMGGTFEFDATPEIIDARWFGVSESAAGADNSAALTAAFATGAKRVMLPQGNIPCAGAVNVAAPAGDAESWHIFGMGRQTKLIFSSGGLVFSGKAAKNSVIERLHVEMSGTSQIGIDFADVDVLSSPTRWTMRDVWARSSNAQENTGIRLRGGWIGSIFNPVLQNCSIGLSIVQSADSPFVSFNNLNIFGGEIQGNETGVDAAGVLGLNFFGTAIEGNRGNGVRLRSGCRNVLFSGAYFEANGIDDNVGTNDVRIEVAAALDTMYGVTFQSCVFLNGGSGADDAIWVNKCSGLVIDETCAFNGYVNRLNVQEIAATVVTGEFRAIAPDTGIAVTNNSNQFGKRTTRTVTLEGISLPDAASTTAGEVYFALPAKAGELGTIKMIYTATAAGNVLFRIQPVNLATGAALTVLDIVSTAAVGRNTLSSLFNFGSRGMQGVECALVISRLGTSGSDTNTGAVTIRSVFLESFE